jgi:predicted O-methyltransferase YrrM
MPTVASSPVDFCLRALPASLLRRAGFKLLRLSSGEFRAATELFTPPFDHWVEWRSGLGPAIHVLYGLMRALAPEVVVEIGSARGRSTCALALACRQNGRGKVYAVDPHSPNAWSETGGDSGEFLRRRLREYELDSWCEVVKATSEEAARTWSRPIDFLFLDGDHTLDGVRKDFELFQPWLSDGALVAFHDTTWDLHKDDKWYRPDIGVPSFMHILQQRGYHSVTLPAVPGLTILHARPGGFRFLSTP